MHKRLQTLTLSLLAQVPLKVYNHFDKIRQIGLRPALVEVCSLAAFMVTCKLGP